MGWWCWPGARITSGRLLLAALSATLEGLARHPRDTTHGCTISSDTVGRRRATWQGTRPRRSPESTCTNHARAELCQQVHLVVLERHKHFHSRIQCFVGSCIEGHAQQSTITPQAYP